MNNSNKLIKETLIQNLISSKSLKIEFFENHLIKCYKKSLNSPYSSYILGSIVTIIRNKL